MLNRRHTRSAACSAAVLGLLIGISSAAHAAPLNKDEIMEYLLHEDACFDFLKNSTNISNAFLCSDLLRTLYNKAEPVNVLADTNTLFQVARSHNFKAINMLNAQLYIDGNTGTINPTPSVLFTAWTGATACQAAPIPREDCYMNLGGLPVLPLP